MTYTVTWLPSAIEDLATLWVEASDRNAVTSAANRIDRSLRTDASDKGFEVFGERVLFEPPLIVTFSVSDEDRLVEVTDVELVSFSGSG